MCCPQSHSKYWYQYYSKYLSPNSTTLSYSICNILLFTFSYLYNTIFYSRYSLFFLQLIEKKLQKSYMRTHVLTTCHPKDWFHPQLPLLPPRNPKLILPRKIIHNNQTYITNNLTNFPIPYTIFLQFYPISQIIGINMWSHSWPLQIPDQNKFIHSTLFCSQYSPQ